MPGKQGFFFEESDQMWKRWPLLLGNGISADYTIFLLKWYLLQLEGTRSPKNPKKWLTPLPDRASLPWALRSSLYPAQEHFLVPHPWSWCWLPHLPASH